MPKFRFDTQPKYYNKVVSDKNCDDILNAIRILVDNYFNFLSLNDKKQILYIANTIKKYRQVLPENKRYGYNKSVNEMLKRYQEMIK